MRPHLPRALSGTEPAAAVYPARQLEGLGSKPSLAWPTFLLSLALTPHLFLLQLPQEVNSLKLLIKNILFSPQGLLPCDFSS
jgi:hypothetical protein